MWLSVGILSIPREVGQLERPNVLSSILLWTRIEGAFVKYTAKPAITKSAML